MKSKSSKTRFLFFFNNFYPSNFKTRIQTVKNTLFLFPWQTKIYEVSIRLKKGK